MKKYRISVTALLALMLGCTGRHVYSITYHDSEEILMDGPIEAAAGSEVRFSVRNEPGEFYVNVTVDGVDYEPAEETKEDLNYVFEMPQKDVEVGICRKSRPWLGSSREKDAEASHYGELLSAFCLQTFEPSEQRSFLEITLYESDSEHMRMETCRNGGTPEEETVAYLVPKQIYDRLLETVRKYDMASWQETGTDTEIGDRFCSFFWTEGGNVIRVTSDHMPADGQEAFDAIENELALYMEEQDIIE